MDKIPWNKKLKSIAWSARQFRPLPMVSIVIFAAGVTLFTPLDMETSDKISLFSLITAFCGALLVVAELKMNQNTTKCNMIIKLNSYYHDNDSLMKVYEALEDENRNLAGESNFTHITKSEIASFMDFYENIAYLTKAKVISIADIDDLFGYRFFSFMHCPYLQECHILPSSSSYIQIFGLYEKWIQYRENRATHGVDGAVTVRSTNRYENDYLIKRLYLHDPGYGPRVEYNSPKSKKKCIHLLGVTFPEISKVLTLQDDCVPPNTPHEEYIPLTRSKLLESMHLDRCIGAYVDDKLIGFAIFVSNRSGSRNLGASLAGAKPAKAITFDALFVHPDFRGLGIQRKFIKLCRQFAMEHDVTDVYTITAPNNPHAQSNFLLSGFKPIPPKRLNEVGGILLHLKLTSTTP